MVINLSVVSNNYDSIFFDYIYFYNYNWNFKYEEIER